MLTDDLVHDLVKLLVPAESDESGQWLLLNHAYHHPDKLVDTRLFLRAFIRLFFLYLAFFSSVMVNIGSSETDGRPEDEGVWPDENGFYEYVAIV